MGFVESLIIPEGYTEIEKFAFSGQPHEFGLTYVAMPNTMRTIGDFAFSRCKSLHTVQLNGGLQKIGGCAFNECSALKAIIIPDTVTVIGQKAFSECENLACVQLSRNISVIDRETFTNDKSLMQILIPNSVEVIKGGAFRYCGIFDSFQLPPKLRSLSLDALPTIRQPLDIPDSVTEIWGSRYGSTMSWIVCGEGSYTHKYCEANKIKCQLRNKPSPQSNHIVTSRPTTDAGKTNRTNACINVRQTSPEPKDAQTDYLRELLGIGEYNRS